MLDWSDYEDEEEGKAERCFWRKVGFAIFLGIALAMIFGPLYGCATREGPRHEVCRFQLIGQNPNGMPLVDVLCVTPEKFAESQK